MLIVGQGLAGSLLARRLAPRARLAVVDPGVANASRVAAGLMTPLTGRRFSLTPDYPRLFARAGEALGDLGVLRPASVYRMFADAEQRAAGLRRADCRSCAGFIERITSGPGQLDPGLDDPHGGALMRGAWADLPRLLDDTASWLGGRLVRDEVRPGEIAEGPDGVEWSGIRASSVVWCDGWRAGLPGGVFADLAWQPAKGEALDLLSDAPAQERILNREGWALSLGAGRWRTGTNWSWDDLGETPSETLRPKLVARFAGFFRDPVSVDVTRHLAGTRPCTRDSRPFLGRHPVRRRHWLLNGLGPRGTVWAPEAADLLAAAILDGAEIPPELDLRRAPCARP